MKIIFDSHANKTHFHKKGCALGLILKVKVLGTQKWPIEQTEKCCKMMRLVFKASLIRFSDIH